MIISCDARNLWVYGPRPLHPFHPQPVRYHQDLAYLMSASTPLSGIQCTHTSCRFIFKLRVSLSAYGIPCFWSLCRILAYYNELFVSTHFCSIKMALKYHNVPKGVAERGKCTKLQHSRVASFSFFQASLVPPPPPCLCFPYLNR